MNKLSFLRIVKPSIVCSLEGMGKGSTRLQSVARRTLVTSPPKGRPFTSRFIKHFKRESLSLPFPCSMVMIGMALSYIHCEATENHLTVIAEHLNIPVETTDQKAWRDKCFKTVYKTAKENWKALEPIKAHLKTLTDSAGRTLFMQAIVDREYELAKLLLEELIGITDEKGHFLRDNEGNTALHLAVCYGSSGFIQFLLSKGFPLDDGNKYQQTPVHLAINRGNVSALRLLIKEGASVELSAIWNVGENRSLTLSPLALAIFKKNIPCVDEILQALKTQNNAAIIESKLQIPSYGNALHFCIEFSNKEMLEHLLSVHHAIFQHLMTGNSQDGLLPFAFAAARGNIAALHLLKAKGADIECADTGGRRAAHQAALYHQGQVLHLLAYWGANLEATDLKGFTPYSLVQDKPSAQMALTAGLILSLIAKAKNKTLEAPDFSLDPPENLVFKGGGPKGIAYVGAIQALEKAKKMDAVKRIAGTSAGAITAMLLVLDHRGSDLQKILEKTDLTEFLDTPSLKKPLGGDSKITISQIIEMTRRIRHYTSNPSDVAKDLFNLFWQTTGICEGEIFRKWAEKIVKDKTGIDHLTFKELRTLINQGKPYKHLYIFATRVDGTTPSIICFNSEDGENNPYDDVIISDAVRASMSIPGAFKPHSLHTKSGKKRVKRADLGQFVDGGLVRNFPLDAFDEKRFQTTAFLGAQATRKQTNNRTLGFNLFSSKPEEEVDPSSLKTVGDLALAIAKTFYHAEDLLQSLNLYDKYRTINIPDQNVGTLNFKINQETTQLLIQGGREATEAFMMTAKEEIELFKSKTTLTEPHPDFIGRKELLEALKKTLLPVQFNPDLLSMAVLCGEGGVGKTETAIKFANDFEKQFSLMWIISCENKKTQEKAYRELAAHLSIEIKKDTSFKEVQSKVHNFLQTEKFNHPWLLIFDNAEEEISLPSKGGSVLITSRDPTLWQKQNEISVGSLSEEEALQLVEKITTLQRSSDMKKLVELLGYYPLVLAQAAHYIESTEVDMAEFISRIEKNLGAVLNHLPPSERYLKTLKEIWELSKERLNSYPEALHWLEVSSYLSPEPVPQEWIEEWLQQQNPDLDRVEIEFKKDEILRILNSRSLVRKEGKTLLLHRLKRQVIQETQKNPRTYKRQALELVSSIVAKLDIKNPEQWNKLEQWEMHALEMLQQLKDAADLRSASSMLFTLGIWNHAQGRYEEALKYALQSLEIKKCLFKDKDDSDLALSYTQVGINYGKLREYKKAVDYILLALDMQKRLYKDKDDPDLAISYTQLGKNYGRDGKHEKSLEYILLAVEMQKRLYQNQDNPDLAASYTRLGKSYAMLGQYEKALEYTLLALDMRKRLYKGKNHPDLAASYLEVGRSYGALGQYEKALEHTLLALDMRTYLYKGKDHPHLAFSYFHAAISYGKLGQYEKALNCALLALDMQKRLFKDKDHADLANFYIEVGKNYGLLRQHEKALEYVLLSLEMRKRLFKDKDHSHLAASYISAGISYDKLEQYEKALEYKLRGLEIYKRLYKEKDNPFFAASYVQVGETFNRLGQYEKALEHKLQGLEIQKRFCKNKDNPYLATFYVTIGTTYDNLGQHEKALEYKLQGLGMHKRLYREKDNLFFAGSYVQVGETYNRLGQHEKALEYRIQGLEIYKRLFKDEDDSYFADAYAQVGISYSALGQHEKSLEYGCLALDMRKRLFKEKDHSDLASSYNDVGNSYSNLGQQKKAKESLFLSLNMYQRLYPQGHPQIEILQLRIQDLNKKSQGFCTIL